jgi:CBS domain-containing protein
MKCSELMKIQVECAGRTESIQEIARRMRDRNIGFLPVCEEQGTVIGTVTDRDIAVRAVAAGRDPGRTTVEEIMTDEVVACRAEDDLSVAEQRMEAAKKSRIVIVDERDRPAGIISLSDIAMVEPRATAVRVLASVASREVHG